MVKLKTKLGSKGQIVIPKPIREKLNLKPGENLLIDFDDEKKIIVIEKELSPEEIITWLKKNRKPVVEPPLESGIEDEFNENFS